MGELGWEREHSQSLLPCHSLFNCGDPRKNDVDLALVGSTSARQFSGIRVPKFFSLFLDLLSTIHLDKGFYSASVDSD